MSHRGARDRGGFGRFPGGPSDALSIGIGFTAVAASF
jgi:hypothetical protein